MTKYTCIVLLVMCFAFACQPKAKQTRKSEISSCLKQKIEEFAKQDCKTGSKVKEYVLAKQHVFAFEPGNCGADMTTEVVDEKCKNLGYLGGITGNTVINGLDFSGAVFVKTLWESPSY